MKTVFGPEAASAKGLTLVTSRVWGSTRFCVTRAESVQASCYFSPFLILTHITHSDLLSTPVEGWGLSRPVNKHA